ncbi:calsequestrin-2-like [Schistocerca americana]|nr:calsequestrin-2-like [Schistocerca americana]XP_046983049.1 calsequestrin-2-like [Schistocerca americana]XP_046984132.1 calsequestrin-2-like [Schistocerca americana]XP_046987361.1 calsequestrin-2-like [Schistocerca americana]XP_046990527.1 calsequestrin-2-like [Schistocerca americana]XP_046992740.1 calsequestrin-2-like [Schistocerca americana]XP_046995806.1 calsequestrin-2-like [Schistocerca americana]XP_046995841.1 calsequestrin-2-like [Schistocerca americana]XP_046995882.1 calsequestri
MTKLLQLVKEGFETISQDDWSAYCLHVEKLEREYWVKDGVMEDIIDAIVINLESDDDEDDDDDDSNDSDNVDDDL